MRHHGSQPTRRPQGPGAGDVPGVLLKSSPARRARRRSGPRTRHADRVRRPREFRLRDDRWRPGGPSQTRVHPRAIRGHRRGRGGAVRGWARPRVSWRRETCQPPPLKLVHYRLGSVSRRPSASGVGSPTPLELIGGHHGEAPVKDKHPLPPGIQAIYSEMASRHFRPLEEVNAFLQRRMDEYNAAPQAELGGLSPVQMYDLLSGDWKLGPASPRGAASRCGCGFGVRRHRAAAVAGGRGQGGPPGHAGCRCPVIEST